MIGVIRLDEKRDLYYLIDEITKSEQFWKVNYYLCSMKKAPHGGIIDTSIPNYYLRYFLFDPMKFVTHNPENIPFFMNEVVEFALSVFETCNNLDQEELLRFCFDDKNWYLGYRLLHPKPEYQGLAAETLIFNVMDDENKKFLDCFDILPRYMVYALILILVKDRFCIIQDVGEIQKHERLRNPHNKYGLCKLDNVEFARQGFYVDEKYYQYNIFINPSIASATDIMPQTFRIISSEIKQKDIYMRCDENLAVPKSFAFSTATMDFQKYHGITLDFSNIKRLVDKNIIVCIHPTLGHKLVMVIKPDVEVVVPFYHIEIEELWEPTSVKDKTVLATFVHAKFFPDKNCFTHMDFSVNQYNKETYRLKYLESVNETGVPVDKYCDIHYKVWCVESESIEIATWSNLVYTTLDEPFRELFLEMYK